MKVLVVENELYLAQSITVKLIDVGYQCEYAGTIKDAISHKNIDVVLLSTNIADQNFQPVLDHFKKSIIILMVSYVNNDTVGKPLKSGASDYLVKPFMIEELIRKIEHYKEFNKFKKENITLKKYINHSLSDIKIQNPSKNQKLPLLIKTNHQKTADYFAIKLAEISILGFDYMTLSNIDNIEKIKDHDKRDLLYLTDFQELKKSDKLRVIQECEKKLVIISTTNIQEIIEGNIETIIIKSDIKGYEDGEILSIEDYLRNVLTTQQDKYPDTELSKKLGISRKSLWEKRKKYGITKTKK